MAALPPPPQSPAERLSPRNIDFLLEQVQARIRVQEEQWGTIRTRATVVLGSAGLILSRSAEIHGGGETQLPSTTVFALYATLGASLLFSSIAALTSFLQYRMRNDPDPGALVRGYLRGSVNRTRLHLLTNLIESHEYNRGVLRRVNAPLRWAVSALIMGLVVFFVIVLDMWGARWLGE